MKQDSSELTLRDFEFELELAGAEQALLRAARRAREKAAQFGRGIMIWRDGRVVELMPDDSIRELPGNEAVLES